MSDFPQALAVDGAVAVFADAHLGQVERDAEDFLDALEGVRRRGFGTAVLLGDIFHYFIGDPKLETPLLMQTLQGLKEVAARGLSLRYVEGNRDFFVAGSRYAEPFASWTLADGLRVGATRYAFVHGDRVNTADLPYRFWRGLSKNPLARATLNVIPKAAGNRLVWKTEARLYKSNFKHKTRLPVEMIRQFAERRFAQGVDTVLLGHFHKSWVENTGHGVVEILPAFVDEHRWMEIADDGSTSLVPLRA